MSQLNQSNDPLAEYIPSDAQTDGVHLPKDCGMTGPFIDQEKDSCAIVAVLSRTGEPTHTTLREALSGLQMMEHRAGQINNEGDGCGVQVDIPRHLWERWLRKEGRDPQLAHDPRFIVAHIYTPRVSETAPNPKMPSESSLREEITRRFMENGLEVLSLRKGQVLSGRIPKESENEPLFWQAGLLVKEGLIPRKVAFDAKVNMETDGRIHIGSLSGDVAVYKVKGTSFVLAEYFLDFQDPQMKSRAVLGHSRYSTNTLSVTERVQPFSILGHNGEINTIDKLRRESAMLGIPPVKGGSDSQDLDRTIEGLMVQFGFSLMEAMEIVFPPITHIISALDPKMRQMYFLYRRFLGPLAQGPAAIIARYENEVVFSVDALGLRPMWLFETRDMTIVSSERGIIPSSRMISQPKPFAPGEKMAFFLDRGTLSPMMYPEIQETLYSRYSERFHPNIPSYARPDNLPLPSVPEILQYPAGTSVGMLPAASLWNPFGYSTDDHDMISFFAQTSFEPIGSLGFDGPLAVLSKDRTNIPDYFKENVAVVTNPAIDREREMEHFSPRIVLGPRPLFGDQVHTPRGLDLALPILLGGDMGEPLLPPDRYRALADRLGIHLLEDLPRHFPQGHIRTISSTFLQKETMKEALQRIHKEAVAHAESGAEILIIDDSRALLPGHLWIDPALTTALVDRALRKSPPVGNTPNLRRNLSIIVHSGSIRNLHDTIFTFSIGADAINPHIMFETALTPVKGEKVFDLDERERRIENVVGALKKGIEKVISTMGIHEMRGYGRLFSSIGVGLELSEIFATPHFLGGEKVGLSIDRLEQEARARAPYFHGEKTEKLSKTYHLYPKVWKLAGDVANQKEPYSKYQDKLSAVEIENPISLRHLLDIAPGKNTVPVESVDLKVGDQDYPFIISSMSFGSQGEVAYRAYAEASEQMNIICLNGEGGEILELIGKYPKSRGQQIASGRFGVNIALLNSSNLVEIKIGQGAKPGEGGHLPGKKVSAKVANARKATMGVDLISPSNNHDLYSIEDLAQLVAELKSANPKVRVAVKVPVISGIGTIGIGIAKAGADIITVSGFDGGTGAARMHALRYVGLPVEIGVTEVHRALLYAGLRDKVEIWADGGLKSSTDVLKIMCLGANRVGFGTLPMVAIGCTICRECQMDTCHVGIATQIETEEQAHDHGLKRFVPRDFEFSVRQLKHFFTGMGEDLRRILAEIGVERAQSIVGETGHLIQIRHFDRIDLTPLLNPSSYNLDPEGFCGVSPQEEGVTLGEKITSEVERSLRLHPRAVTIQVDRTTSMDRNIGTHLSGVLHREYPTHPMVTLLINNGSITGNGMGAFIKNNMTIRVTGGAQDGVGKGAMAGRIVVLKAKNEDGKFVDGSVGKSLAYGAQGGRFLIQGDCDSRAGIRLSGAEMVIGGRITAPINDHVGHLGIHSNMKGFAFEYMTNGRAVVLGDPGPWICAGMTGGTVYLLKQPNWGFDEEAIRRRIAKGSKVVILPITKEDEALVRGLLEDYAGEIAASGQEEETKWLSSIISSDLRKNFIRIIPQALQVEQTVSTE
ncbi:MAG: glutamate synthase-related protein [Leptospirillum sp.]